MPAAENIYADSQEALVVGLARSGDRDAFAELVRRRQAWIQNLMRSFSADPALADDLAQQVFLQAWRKIAQMRKPQAFGAWLKQIAVTTWLQHLRRNDALNTAEEYQDAHAERREQPGLGMDLDQALATLPGPVRTCIVLSYQERMTHPEIAAMTRMPPGTVKSHIRRGTRRLQQLLSDYREQDAEAPHEH